MTTHGYDGTTLQIWKVMRALHRIATGEELRIEQAGKYFSNPRALVEVVRSSGALRDPWRAAAIERLLNDDRAGLRDAAA